MLIAIVLALLTLAVVGGGLAVAALVLARAARGHQFETALRADAEVEYFHAPRRTFAPQRAA